MLLYPRSFLIRITCIGACGIRRKPKLPVVLSQSVPLARVLMDFFARVPYFAFVIVILVTVATVAQLSVALFRRWRDTRSHRQIQKLRQLCAPTINAAITGYMPPAKAVGILAGICRKTPPDLLERLFLSQPPSSRKIPLLRAVCRQLGLVKKWETDLTGTSGRRRSRWFSFLRRARSAYHLGILRCQESWPVLVKALQDPHADVKAAAAIALARIAEPQSLPALVGCLNQVSASKPSAFPLWSLRSGLAVFPLEAAGALLPSLKSPNVEARIIAVEALAGMVARAAMRPSQPPDKVSLPAALLDALRDDLRHDPRAEVRAWTATILPRVVSAGTRDLILSLRDDPEWLVRLHALRALASWQDSSLLGEISQGLEDPHWRVRECAVQELYAAGPSGIHAIFSALSNIRDPRYLEEVAEGIQRYGLVPELARAFQEEDDESAYRAVRRLIDMGKLSYLGSALARGPQLARAEWLQQAIPAPSPESRQEDTASARPESSRKLDSLAPRLAV
jgi:HEAT repeat protein